MDLDNLEEEEQSPPEVKERKPYAAFLRSGILDGEVIIILKDRTKLNDLKKSYPDNVIYLPQEIDKVEQFKGDPAAIKAIHAAKKKFEGWIY